MPPAVENLTPEDIDVEKLLYDAKNPRLVEVAGPDPDQDTILQILWREFAVDEIALSIASHGFWRHEPIFATEEDGALVVIEGNRRLAAVRLLRDGNLRRRVKATDLPTITVADKRKLATLPVIRTTRAEVWQYIGFKHVNGPQAWQSYAKAQYTAYVHNDLGIPLREIATQIGDQHSTVERLYRALMVVEQAESSGDWTREDRFKRHFSFSHLYTGLDYGGFQAFLKLSKDKGKSKPVPKKNTGRLIEVMTWLYGSRSRDKPPLVRSQNPDLRLLDEVLQSPDGVAALRQGLTLGISRDISKGDDVLFREHLIQAKFRLEQARAKLITGYEGEKDLLETAEDSLDLAQSMVEEMSARAKKRRSASRA